MKMSVCAVLAMCALVPMACERTATPPTPVGTATPAAVVVPAGFFLTAAPENAKPVEDVKKDAKLGDTVAVSGRIGGSAKPFVAERAVATLMGPGIPPCAEGCFQPWDYCCESREDIARHSATVQVVDAAGAPLHLNLKGQNGLKELSEVVVVGKVTQVEGPVLVISATGMFVKP